MLNKFYIIFTLIISSLLFGQLVFAGSPQSALDRIKGGATSTANKAGLQTTRTPERIVGGIIQQILAFLGVVLVIIIVYAGFLWLTAGGNPDQVKKAKQWMINAVIGMIIVLAAYVITKFVVDSILTATVGPESGVSNQP